MNVGIHQDAEQEWVKEHWPHARIECLDESVEIDTDYFEWHSNSM
jgi:hypothetical protein